MVTFGVTVDVETESQYISGVSKSGFPDRSVPQRPAPSAAGGGAPPPVTLDAVKLFDGRPEIRLLHRGQEYRLRITKQGKLILTK